MHLPTTLSVLRHRLLPLLLGAAAVICLLACTKKDQPMSTVYTPVNSNAQDPNAKRYLALGDSYTIGTSVPETDRFPVLTADFLQAMGIKTRVDIIATNGWTSTDLLLAIRERPVTNNYDMVSVLIGVNNPYQGKSLDVYKTEFAEILQRAIQLADGKPTHVVVLSI
ncbi:MAG TPA: GDSL-type esterase/lipase family protein, partial [Chitinophagaceae bacterium]|nr:GDSL-type esterase/lipase family protein [Chitinophagaceae bacterium]